MSFKPRSKNYIGDCPCESVQAYLWVCFWVRHRQRRAGKEALLSPPLVGQQHVWCRGGHVAFPSPWQGPALQGVPSRTGGGAVFPNWISSEPVPTIQFGSCLVPGNSPEKIRCRCLRKKGTKKQMGGGGSLFTIFLALFNGGWLAIVDFSFHWTLLCVGKDAVLQTF